MPPPAAETTPLAFHPLYFERRSTYVALLTKEADKYRAHMSASKALNDSHSETSEASPNCFGAPLAVKTGFTCASEMMSNDRRQQRHSAPVPYEQPFSSRLTSLISDTADTGVAKRGYVASKELVSSMRNGRVQQTSRRKSRQNLRPREKGHPCPLGLCDGLFSTKYNAKAHTRLHTKEMPFACQDCGARFKWCSSKSNHKKAKCGIKVREKSRKKSEKKHKDEVRVKTSTKGGKKTTSGRDEDHGLFQEVVTSMARMSCRSPRELEYEDFDNAKSIPSVVSNAGSVPCLISDWVGESSEMEIGKGAANSDVYGMLWSSGVGDSFEVSRASECFEDVTRDSQILWQIVDPVRDIGAGRAWNVMHLEGRSVYDQVQQQDGHVL